MGGVIILLGINYISFMLGRFININILFCMFIAISFGLLELLMIIKK